MKVTVTMVLVALAAAAIGAVAALYWYCPMLCRQQVKGAAASFLEKILPAPLARGIADELPV